MPESQRIPLLLQRLWFGPAPAGELRALIDDGRFDGYVLDHSLASCAAVAEALRLPAAVLFHSVARARRRTPTRLDDYLPGLNDVRAAYGLAPMSSVLDAWRFASLRIICSARAFDAPELASEPGDLYVGPIAERRPPGPPREVEGEGPLVLVSFSTTWQGQLDALQETVVALGRMQVRVLVTVGPEIKPSELHAPPGVVVAQYVPHTDVLPTTDVVVTHAGHGTVMAALAAGVPMVCLPMGRDQFTNANLVEQCGAGIQVRSASEIAPAVAHVLATESYRAAAQRMSGEIAREPGARAAADAIEDLATSPTT